MTEAYAIKPCPFCGGEAEIVRKGTTRQSMQIACTNCNTQVESGDVIGLTPPEKWHWNNRVPVTVSENTTPVCPNCGATSWADFYRGSSVIASVCKKCDHKITPPVTAVSDAIDHAASQASQAIQNTAYSWERPSVLFRPTLSLDGNQWCALYGNNLHDGVSGFGDSPAEAMYDFDKAWSAKIGGKP